MSYLGKASNDYACPTGLGDNRTIINICIRLVVKIQRRANAQERWQSIAEHIERGEVQAQI